MFYVFFSFENMGDIPTRLQRAYKQLCLTHYTRAAYANNVRNAYSIMAQRKCEYVIMKIIGVSALNIYNTSIKCIKYIYLYIPCLLSS